MTLDKVVPTVVTLPDVATRCARVLVAHMDERRSGAAAHGPTHRRTIEVLLSSSNIGLAEIQLSFAALDDRVESADRCNDGISNTLFASRMERLRVGVATLSFFPVSFQIRTQE